MKKILLVDDDPRVRAVVAATLSDGDFLIVQAESGGQAVDLARIEHPDLLLLDVGMPGLDGFEVCRILKADPATADIKVIILTARSDQADEIAASWAGSDGFFSKPFSPIALLDRVYQLLE